MGEGAGSRPDQFDQRHLIELHRRGLLERLPMELGPMPIANFGPQLWEDLIRWRIVDGATETLNPEAKKLFDGLINYEWAVWGIVLLYNERRRVVADLPAEFFRFGVQHAVRDIPRVTFLIGVLNQRVTTAVLANGELDISSDPAEGPRPADIQRQIAKILLTVLDPGQKWAPYPMTRVSIPAPDSGGRKLSALRNGDPKERKKILSTTTAGLKKAGVTAQTSEVIAELLSQDNPASAQITVTRKTGTGRHTARDNAAGVLFFGGTKTGVVVSYPTRAPDHEPWVTYEPGSVDGVARAIAALQDGLEAADPAAITVR
ncbi:hypothetical protein AN480_28390 (plasmid) [Mycobacterium intracellulare subsp. chimaera]|uniref:ESX secretion-associated protein EspG n=1 Tax=Mycobacterium intracellulare subsp. chimaera TaxID=222805 RepID=A0ABT7P5W9_MYCIT|nr:ESX secretion-associated protein EspG [Mycobacterium intracellulare]AOS94964.1 hypothetical protein AN480_28390 [Mycobacterium intracellulare subsp. chimaera]MDM3928684.1 ESX secretion-associated protein EspG [Mycobacterium intracellulare subsp. chimaera]